MSSQPFPATKPGSKLPFFGTRPQRPLPTAQSGKHEIAEWLRDWADLNWGPKSMGYQQIWDLADSIDPPT